MSNSEGITLETVQGKPVIGLLQNNWRQRHVVVYDHPTDPNQVVSVGHPFNGSEPVMCVEPRGNYTRVINAYPKTATYD